MIGQTTDAQLIAKLDRREVLRGVNSLPTVDLPHNYDQMVG